MPYPRLNRTTILLLGGSLFALVFLIVYFWPEEPAAPSAKSQHFLGSTESPAVFTDLQGDTVAAPDLDTAVLVVTTWASWSPFTEADFAILERVAASYDKNVVNIIALNRSEVTTTAQRYLATVKAPNGVHILIDTNDTFYEAIEGYTVPETIVYDQTGAVSAHIRGALSETTLRAAVAAALNSEAE